MMRRVVEHEDEPLEAAHRAGGLLICAGVSADTPAIVRSKAWYVGDDVLLVHRRFGAAFCFPSRGSRFPPDHPRDAPFARRAHLRRGLKP